MLLMHLNSQLLLNGDWIEGASFYCAVVCNYHGVHPVYLANLGFTDSYMNSRMGKSNFLTPVTQPPHGTSPYSRPRPVQKIKKF